jgi:hypothetical protein
MCFASCWSLLWLFRHDDRIRASYVYCPPIVFLRTSNQPLWAVQYSPSRSLGPTLYPRGSISIGSFVLMSSPSLLSISAHAECRRKFRDLTDSYFTSLSCNVLSISLVTTPYCASRNTACFVRLFNTVRYCHYPVISPDNEDSSLLSCETRQPGE